MLYRQREMARNRLNNEQTGKEDRTGEGRESEITKSKRIRSGNDLVPGSVSGSGLDETSKLRASPVGWPVYIIQASPTSFGITLYTRASQF